MRPIIAVHGVTPRKEAAGFSAAFSVDLEQLARKQDSPILEVIECIYSDLLHISALGALDVAADVIRYEMDNIARLPALGRLDALLAQYPGAICVAHSMGSILAIDHLIRCHEPPWHALVTIGSPGGVDIPALPGIAYRDRIDMLKGRDAGIWLDLWAPGDPIATATIAGVSVPGITSVAGLQSAGYPCDSVEIDTGTHPMTSHTTYWQHPTLHRLVLALASQGEQ